MPISFDVLHKALEAGMFLLLLDGFDELRHDHRGSLIADVTEATGRYRENDFIITSRPGENFNHLTEFHEYSVEPLSLPSAAELVRRSGYADAVVRSTFCSLLEEQLFNSHESFASNPLLLSIMLMTFRSFAQIPTKLSLFYGKAFSVLWDKHDAGKAGDGQIRERRSGLDEDDFVRVLEDISILTQIKSLFEFDDTILKQLILISQQMRLLEFPSTGYIHDLEEGVSLIVKDGLEYRFAHRSLQEYFAARFVVSTDASRRTRLIGPLIARVREDNVLPLVNELAPEKFERDILAPTLAALRSQLGIKSGMSITYEEYICGAIESVKLRRSEIEFRENETVIGAMNLIQKVYSILEENDLGDSELYDPQRIFARWIQEVELRNPKDVLESQPEYCVRLSKTEIIDRIAELERIVFPSHPHLSRKFFERLREIVAHIEHRMEKQGTTIEAALFDGEMQITSTSRKTSN